jgi:2-succinyl-6-hydroxy-2,4-cyclohexadiene-1-carboxylate synthase
MGSGADWLPLVPDWNCYSLMPDLPGHGANFMLDLTQPLDLDILTTQFIAWLDTLGLAEIDLLGYSMGGRLALHVAVTHPQRIKRLILESANPGLIDSVARQARAKWDDEQAMLLTEMGLAQFLEHWYNLPLFQSLHRQPARLLALKQQRQQHQPLALAKVIRDLSPGRQRPLWSKLADLPMPVLLVAGALDSKYMELLTAMQPQIPQAKLVILPQSGHNVHYEQPELFGQTVQAGLSGHCKLSDK